MVYGEYLRGRHSFGRILEEEFGITSGGLSRRLVVTPLPLEEVLVGFEELLTREGIEYKWIRPRDPILGLGKGSLRILLDGSFYYVLFIGRGAIEAVDRAWIIGHDPGVEEVLFIGAAASLKRGLQAGSCNIPIYTLNIGDPSLVYAGLPNGLPIADRGLAHRVSRIAEDLGCGVASVLHASIPYFYIETRRFLEYLSSVGVHTIDMELAYVLRMLDAMGKRAAGLLVVEDSPLHGIEYMSRGYEEVRDAINETKRILSSIILEFLHSK